MKKPPKKLSSLIKLALADLLKVERNKSVYTVDMNAWHEAVPHTGKCSVCFAGLVMAKTLKALPTEARASSDFSTEWQAALHALDCVRTGYVRDACETYGKELSELEYGVYTVTPYAEDKSAWRKDMHKIVRMLEKVGL